MAVDFIKKYNILIFRGIFKHCLSG